ncbi:DUF4383 domain-containing protein [Aquipuribacter nitratireducens]|uniref:DUF4383 domain-containing protein n=1 Tax=Aquipuribacter nitratireducens TaxID=650104 RepID=A0ABW0GJI1_9MICO
MSTSDSRPSTARRSRTVPQVLALVIGVVYLLIGLLGFFVTGFTGWFEHDPDQTLLGFAINPFHNVVHLVIGAAGVALASSDSRARLYGWLLVVGYGATLVYGFFVAGQDTGNILNINVADNWLHGFSVLAGLATALWPRHRDRDVSR